MTTSEGHGRRDTGTPWEDDEGFVSIPKFLAAYAKDDNAFWRAQSGDIQNVVDVLLEMLRTVHPEHPQPDICEACLFLGRITPENCVPIPQRSDGVPDGVRACASFQRVEPPTKFQGTHHWRVVETATGWDLYGWFEVK